VPDEVQCHTGPSKQSAQSTASSTAALHQPLLLPTNGCCPTAAQVISVAGTDGSAIGFPPLASRPVRAAPSCMHAKRPGRNRLVFSRCLSGPLVPFNTVGAKGGVPYIITRAPIPNTPVPSAPRCVGLADLSVMPPQGERTHCSSFSYSYYLPTPIAACNTRLWHAATGAANCSPILLPSTTQLCSCMQKLSYKTQLCSCNYSTAQHSTAQHRLCDFPVCCEMLLQALGRGLPSCQV
jgi:hypothetical protein